jgi:cellobiose-specific phosphotransferase system component IIB
MKFLQAFSIFCGLGIHNTLMYSEVEKAMARQKVAIEVSAKKGREFCEILIVFQISKVSYPVYGIRRRSTKLNMRLS